MNAPLLATFGYWIGLSLCAGVVGGGLLNHWRQSLYIRKRQRQQQTELTEFRQELATRRQTFRARDPAFAAWPGTRLFRFAALADECPLHRSFYLVPVDERPLPTYLPGQYLTLELPLAGASKPLVRCYSLSDRPRQDFYRLTVKRVLPEKPGELPGRGSNFLFDELKVGSSIACRAPAGGFFLDPFARGPVVLIASGIGITPILAMLNEMVHAQPGRKVFVLVGMRNGSSFPFKQYLRELAAEHRNVSLRIWFSRPVPGDEIGRDYQYQGRLNLAEIQNEVGSPDQAFYLCGTGGMMAELVPALELWGVKPEQLHYEAFGPSTVKRMQPNASAGPAEKKTLAVKFTRSQVEATTDGELSLLELAEQAKLPAESGCRAGNCGQCIASLHAGTIRTTKKPGVPLAADQCLTCISYPTSAVEVDL